MTNGERDAEHQVIPGIDPENAVQILPPEADRHRWLALRRTGIGGSDVSALVGLSHYRSPYELWLDKTGQLPISTEPPSEAARWGTLLEPVVRTEFAESHGVRVDQVGMLRSTRYPWMIANPDGLCSDGAGYEGKTCSLRVAHEWDDGQVPDHAELQAQWCMAVTGLDRWHVAVLIGGQRSVHRVVERDAALIDQLITISGRFWADYVETRTEPPADGSVSATQALAARYPVADDEDATVDVDADTAEKLMREKAEAERAVREAEAAYEAVRNRIKALIGDRAQLASGRQVLATWRQVDRIHLARLRRERPDLVEVYTRPVTTDRFDEEAFQADHPELYQQFRVRELRFPR